MNDPRQAVVAKAVKDAAFRAALKKDPAKAVEQATGLKLPPGLSVKVLEDSASVVHLVLPAPEHALSDKELQGVAGGAALQILQPTKPGFCVNTRPQADCG